MRDKLPEPGTNAQGEKYNNLPVGSDIPNPPRLDLGNTSGTPHNLSHTTVEASPTDVAPLPNGGNSLAEFHRKFGGQRGRGV
jgi:hypothetical protein